MTSAAVVGSLSKAMASLFGGRLDCCKEDVVDAPAYDDIQEHDAEYPKADLPTILASSPPTPSSDKDKFKTDTPSQLWRQFPDHHSVPYGEWRPVSSTQSSASSRSTGAESSISQLVMHPAVNIGGGHMYAGQWLGSEQHGHGELVSDEGQ